MKDLHIVINDEERRRYGIKDVTEEIGMQDFRRQKLPPFGLPARLLYARGCGKFKYAVRM